MLHLTLFLSSKLEIIKPRENSFSFKSSVYFLSPHSLALHVELETSHKRMSEMWKINSTELLRMTFLLRFKKQKTICCLCSNQINPVESGYPVVDTSKRWCTRMLFQVLQCSTQLPLMFTEYPLGLQPLNLTLQLNFTHHCLNSGTFKSLSFYHITVLAELTK